LEKYKISSAPYLCVAWIVFIYIKIFVCFVQQACSLPARVYYLCGIFQCT
jgi:hypothetical protein